MVKVQFVITAKEIKGKDKTIPKKKKKSTIFLVPHFHIELGNERATAYSKTLSPLLSQTFEKLKISTVHSPTPVS